MLVCIQTGVSCLNARAPPAAAIMSRANYHNVTLSGQQTPNSMNRQQQRWTMRRRDRSLT
jgi:hypothetical protein